MAPLPVAAHGRDALCTHCREALRTVVVVLQAAVREKLRRHNLSHTTYSCLHTLLSSTGTNIKSNIAAISAASRQRCSYVFAAVFKSSAREVLCGVCMTCV